MQLLLTLWSQVTLKDLIDILIVSAVIYQFLLIVRGTRAVQMLLGVALLGLLFWIGVTYKLYSLNWLLDHFFDSFFIIVVILFQDQIRSALASFGSRGRIFGGLTRERLETEVDEVIEAYHVMGREKVGGIIVFERTNGLNNFIETGTKMDALIHSDLIYAIFQSSSPLHDGAIIISQGKLKAAGCFLPLSKNVDIDRHMGTRHRAALGISEVTDAVALVVSEETGRLSLFINGEFKVCKDVEELRVILKKLWAGRGISDSAVSGLSTDKGKGLGT